MKVVALEEHFVTPDVLAAWHALPPDLRDPSDRQIKGELRHKLLDLSDARLRRMDATGVDVQVLSLTTPAVQNLEPADAVLLARASNDLVAATVRGRQDRFQGFATLPTPDPQAAARELERAVVDLRLNGAMLCGRTRDRNVDHPDFLPIFETAAALRAPLYLHPQAPRPAVRDVYYAGFGEQLDVHFATGGVGWHYETGIQALRLVMSGLFDRLPDLQLILGHWGEVLLFYLDRVDMLSGEAVSASGLKHPISHYFRRNMFVTPSGIFSQRYLRWATEVLGAERIMFSADDPYVSAPEGGAQGFLGEAELSDDDRALIAGLNWDRICSAILR